MADPHATTKPTAADGRRRTRLLILMAVIVMVPAGFGFITKFVEFVRTLRGDEAGGFTILPIVTYLAVAAGFLCLLVWAAMGGMFHDIERPKYTMLEIEAKLDQPTR
jgi:predicted metal-binding membrane protein